MFYRDFYIQFCYLNNPNARDESNNRRYEQKEFICDIFDKLDFKGLLSLDTVKFTVGEDLKDISSAHYNPENLTRWEQVVMETVKNF